MKGKIAHCTPFLLFDGNCAEAMTFYHQCLGGELTLTKLGDTPMKAQFPPEKAIGLSMLTLLVVR
jgi:PhnB protein